VPELASGRFAGQIAVTVFGLAGGQRVQLGQTSLAQLAQALRRIRRRCAEIEQLAPALPLGRPGSLPGSPPPDPTLYYKS